MAAAAKDGFEAVRVFFTGVGGQGTILATRTVAEAALAEGLPVTASEIHGMAQRGGVVESSVVIGSLSSPTIADGEADIVLAFEPLEALRAVAKCHQDSCVITGILPIIPFTVAAGQDTYPPLETILSDLQARITRLLWVDAVQLARQAGNDKAANIVLVGALAGTGELPISPGSWQKSLELTVPPRLLEVNRKAFALGHKLAEDLFGK